jgi:hypothetical protein
MDLLPLSLTYYSPIAVWRIECENEKGEPRARKDESHLRGINSKIPEA